MTTVPAEAPENTFAASLSKTLFKRVVAYRPGASEIRPASINTCRGGRPNAVSTTRFTLITWLPKSLFCQFQRAANIFFLFTSILVLMPFSPTMWSSTVVPFVGVLIWTALKDMYEDMRRKRDDDRENFRKCWRFNIGANRFEQVAWRDVLCGDLLWTIADEAFPADLLLLRACGGQAFISTVNLDGETNLKERQPPNLCSAAMEQAGKDLQESDAQKLDQFRISLGKFVMDQGFQTEFDVPKVGLTEYGGAVELNSSSEPVRQALAQLKISSPCYLNYENFVPRGCVLRNTPWILSIAAYVGDDTKTRLNVAKTDAKISNMQRYLNRCVIGLVLFLCTFCIYAAIMDALVGADDADDENSFVRALQYWIILYQIVPISLYVCFEIMKLVLGFQINMDNQMVDKRTNTRAFARTADLVEELGQVDFIFSDKTGTLTENEMVFARCCIQGGDLGDFRSSGQGQIAPGIAETQKILASTTDARRAEVRWFFFCLTTCHSAQVDLDANSVPVFSGSSPDEVAFLDCAHACGISFHGRRRLPGVGGWELRVVGPPGESPHILSVLCEIPFNSDRKRMSIICEHKGEFFCITKGADNVISQLCDEPFSDSVTQHLMNYSKQGLRTLAIASKIVDQRFLEDWQAKWVKTCNDSSLSSLEREKRLADIAAEMEHSLILSGISAIEDKLQEGVPQAITTVKAAGIRFWVLTGDKTETAVEIVRACKLFTEDMTLAYMVNASTEKDCLELLAAAKQKMKGQEGGGIILDGTFVKFALLNQEARLGLYELAIVSKACVCCRLSPQQKRKLVELVREQNTQTISLAIGDGANDVSMIQGAHIGIGVRGKEGNQAVQASDIAVSQFRFLVPLLLCHGRRAYRRVALFLCYYIYKHVVLVLGDMIWAHQFRFRGEIAYPEWISSAYSLLFTSLPVMVILGFDSDVPDDVAIDEPKLYVEGLARMRFNFKIFGLWMLSGIWHGALAWSIPSIIIGSTDFAIVREDGENEVEMVKDFWLASCVSFTLVIFFVDLRLWMVALNRFSIITIGVLAISIAAFFGVLFGLGHVAPSMQPQIDGIPADMFQDSKCLLCIFLTPLAMIVDFLFIEGQKKLCPMPLDQARANLRYSGKNVQATKLTDPQIVKPATPAW
mmetsp:Transcript_111347/g.175453  ORF Transcript_111347/g.175453 Transcript_111347/m.175453 type:complete len:1136 (+) Transcript_111347:57-3464(+)